MIRVEHLSGDMAKAMPVLRVLRNGLDDAIFAARFADAVQAGYRAMLAMDDARAVGCLGYRITCDVFWGKTLFVDDLVVLPGLRGKGIGAQLLEAAKARACELSCDHIRLCSGLDRVEAHRFYERNGLKRTSLQFVHAVEKGAI